MNSYTVALALSQPFENSNCSPSFRRSFESCFGNTTVVLENGTHTILGGGMGPANIPLPVTLRVNRESGEETTQYQEKILVKAQTHDYGVYREMFIATRMCFLHV